MRPLLLLLLLALPACQTQPPPERRTPVRRVSAAPLPAYPRAELEFGAPPSSRRGSKDDPSSPITLPRYRLYGAPGRTYTLLVCTNLSSQHWQEVWRGIMPSSMVTNLPALSYPASPTLFLRTETLP